MRHFRTLIVAVLAGWLSACDGLNAGDDTIPVCEPLGQSEFLPIGEGTVWEFDDGWSANGAGAVWGRSGTATWIFGPVSCSDNHYVGSVLDVRVGMASGSSTAIGGWEREYSDSSRFGFRWYPGLDGGPPSVLQFFDGEDSRLGSLPVDYTGLAPSTIGTLSAESTENNSNGNNLGYRYILEVRLVQGRGIEELSSHFGIKYASTRTLSRR